MGLIIGLMVGVAGSAAADTSPGGSESQWIFFPYVPNGETLDGAGPWYGTITVQNTENFRVVISVGQTASMTDTSQNLAALEPHASQTFTADELGILSPGAGVTVMSAWDVSTSKLAANLEDANICDFASTTEQLVRGGTANTADRMVGTTNDFSSVVVTQTVNGALTTYFQGTSYLVKNNNSIDWSPGGPEPVSGSTYTVSYTTSATNCRAPVITGVEKHVMATPIMNAETTAATIAVDGYTAIPEQDVPWGPASAVCHEITQEDCYDAGDYVVGLPIFGEFDGHSYLPIVQTNSGWDSIIHISNIDPSSPKYAAVTITLYTAAGQGAFGPSVGEFTTSLGQGKTATIDLAADMGIPDGWVGSAWITSNFGVVANVNRQKPEANMALTNTAAPSLFANTSLSSGGASPLGANVQNSGSGLFSMVAPLILKNYNGWNSGVNIANISELTNTVTVTWVGPTGNVVGSDSVTIPAKAMEYIYTPNTQDLGLNSGFVGAAVLTSLLPFHAAIDEVKYAGVGQDVGQAMSYIATDAGASAAWCTADSTHQRDCDWNKYRVLKPYGSYPQLNIPLIQKGNPLTGLGDTSGINLFNASSEASTTDWVSFYQPSGALAAPTLNAPYEITLGALNTATIYTMDFSEMSAGFQGSAQVVPVAGAGVVFGVSNNVNYDVQGDGSAVYNAVNAWGQFRLYCSQEGTGSWADPGFGSCIYFSGLNNGN